VLAAIFWVIVVFAVIVLIHEGGHYIFARIFDIKVEEFCLGIGPKILGKKRGETFYGICLFPIGGYVKIAGMDPGDERTERSFNTQPAWKRFWVIFGGPLFNFLLAVVLIFSLGFFGYPKNMVWVGNVLPNGPADEAGFQSFDIIAEVEGKQVTSERTLQRIVYASDGRPVDIVLIRRGERITVQPVPRIIEDFNEELPSLGVSLGKAPELTNKVSGVLPNSPAFKEGFKVGDIVIQVNDEPVKDGGEAMEKVDRLGRSSESPSESNPESILIPVSLTVLRNEEQVTLAVTPEFNSQIGENVAFIGLTFTPVLVRLPFREAMSTTWDYLRDISYSLAEGLKSMFSRPDELKKSLVGPVGIANMIAQSAKSGPYQLLIIAILLNINLGLINLFPIPALDGGRLVFIGLEGLFRIKISEHKEAMVHLVGFVMLIGLILFITFNEIFSNLR